MSDKVHRKLYQSVIERRNSIDALLSKLKYKKTVLEDPRLLSQHYQQLVKLDSTIDTMEKQVDEKSSLLEEKKQQISQLRAKLENDQSYVETYTQPKIDEIKRKHENLQSFECEDYGKLKLNVNTESQEFGILVTFAMVVSKNEEYMYGMKQREEVMKLLAKKQHVLGALRDRFDQILPPSINLKLAETVQNGKNQVQNALVSCIYEYLAAIFAMQQTLGILAPNISSMKENSEALNEFQKIHDAAQEFLVGAESDILEMKTQKGKLRIDSQTIENKKEPVLLSINSFIEKYMKKAENCNEMLKYLLGDSIVLSAITVLFGHIGDPYPEQLPALIESLESAQIKKNPLWNDNTKNPALYKKFLKYLGQREELDNKLTLVIEEHQVLQAVFAYFNGVQCPYFLDKYGIMQNLITNVVQVPVNQTKKSVQFIQKHEITATGNYLNLMQLTDSENCTHNQKVNKGKHNI